MFKKLMISEHKWRTYALVAANKSNINAYQDFANFIQSRLEILDEESRQEFQEIFKENFEVLHRVMNKIESLDNQARFSKKNSAQSCLKSRASGQF